MNPLVIWKQLDDFRSGKRLQRERASCQEIKTSILKIHLKQIVKRKQRAFQITGLTWIVERSFAWLGRNRRLSKDYEYMVQTSRP